MKNKTPRIAKTMLKNEGSAGGLTIPDFKLICRSIVMKTTW